jgi:hypothetical protein
MKKILVQVGCVVAIVGMATGGVAGSAVAARDLPQMTKQWCC